MAYTATQLITSAYNLAQIVSAEFESVTGHELQVGLDLLNQILSLKAVNNKLTPYYSKTDITAVVGQEKYNVPNLIEVSTLTYTIGDLRYSVTPTGRVEYFGSPRISNIQTLIYQYHTERVLNGTDIYLYPKPSEAFPIEIWGKFLLTEVDYNDDLLQNYAKFYIHYLEYALAENLCNRFGHTFPPNAAKYLADLESKLQYISPPDLTVQVMTPESGAELNWGDIYFGHGWRP